MTSIEDFTSQYGLVQKIDAFGYLDYLKNNPELKKGEIYLTPETEVHFTSSARKVAGTAIPVFSLRMLDGLLHCRKLHPAYSG